MDSLNIKFLSEEATEVYQNGKLLQYQTIGSSGFDIRAVSVLLINEQKISLSSGNSFILEPNTRACVQVGFAMSMPVGYEMQIRPRSGLAFRHGITIVNSPGTVDSDYRGEIGAILLNTSNVPFEIKLGDRIAQAVISHVYQVAINVVDNIDETTRASGGFGSTGLK